MPFDREARRVLLLATLAGAVTIAGFALAADASAAPQPQPAEPDAGSDAAGQATRPAAVDYAALIADLDADVPAVRRRASLRLNSAGGDALPLVEKALADRECGPEGMARLRKALPFVRARARRDQQAKERQAFSTAAWEAAYRKAGGTDPAFDAMAFDALRRWREDESATADGWRATLAAFQAAAEKGCRNELFLVGYEAVVGEDVHLIPKAFGLERRQGRQGFLRYAAGDGPPIVRLAVCTRVLAGNSWVAAKLATAAGAAAVALAADPAAPPGLADESALAHVLTYATAQPKGPSTADAAQAFVDAFAASKTDRPGYHLFLGERLARWAWEARGNGLPEEVTAEGRRLFKERLTLAREELEASYRLDAADSRAAARMVTVVMGEGGEREEMETWFRRAVAADPDDRAACARKLWYLSPNWYGSHADRLAFGRECLATENWRGGVPMVLVDAHVAASRDAADPNAYFADPVVWDDLRAAFEGHLLNVPDDIRRRSAFARYATLANHWAEADEQFKALGDKADYGPFGGKATYDYYRRKAARLAKLPPATGPSGPS